MMRFTSVRRSTSIWKTETVIFIMFIMSGSFLQYLANSDVPQTGRCRSSKDHVQAKSLRSRSHVHVNFH